METQTDRKVLAAVCPNQMGRRRRRAAHKVLEPRSSSPVSARLGLPGVLKQAFSTIAWDDLEESVRRGSPSLCAQVNRCDDDQHFGDYALDFIADSPSTLESSLSPAELVPFHGCVIPPLQWDTPAEDSSLSCPSTHRETRGPPVSSAGASGAPAGAGRCVNFALGDAGQGQQEGTDTLRERHVHLRQLARRAKHLASVLEELMTVTGREETPPPAHGPSRSPCKRQRLDEGYETESSDSLEDMLRDISTRCNAVLHTSASAKQQGSGVVRARGAFSGLRVSFCSDAGCPATEGAEAEANIWSFRTSVREHGTMRTQAFPHGRSFTARTQEGGYRFRWVPNHS